jgi:homopolymeric O-antigen transport system ATP-binding protein
VSQPIITVQNLSKQFRLGANAYAHQNLREAFATRVRSPFRPVQNHGDTSKELVWALRDVSFEVQPGEVVGVIGRNGAGKSTLLKILSRITEPTSGRAELYGRVGSLLEVGTGFHPELTGRENIFLNGAVLGMKRREIERKFDEIVAFSEIERFLDTPVKRYSSGMYMRLAFAVAAHLEPEILLVDEVLAVGDADFQAKCLGKMGEVARGGRTVLYVSHNLNSVLGLCPRSILIAEGRIHADGPTSDVITSYVSRGTNLSGERVWKNPETAPGNEKLRLRAVRVVSAGKITSEVDIATDVRIEIEFWNLRPGARVTTSIHLLDRMKTGVLASANLPSANLAQDRWDDRPYPEGVFRTVVTLPGNLLNEGRYHVNVILLTGFTNMEVFVEGAITFNVYESGAMRGEYAGKWLGVVRPKLAWQTELLNGKANEQEKPR